MIIFDVRTTNWKVRGIAAVDLGEGIAGGVSFYQFANVDDRCIHTFMFSGLGLGVGAKAKSKAKGFRLRALPMTLDDGSWDDLDCLREFNGDDLDNSVGQVLSAGFALVVGAQLTLISGGISIFDEPFFRLEPCPGFILGVGMGASILTGLWHKLDTTFL